MADTAVEATPGDENDDNWLYGDSNGEQAAKAQEENDKNASNEPPAPVSV